MSRTILFATVILSLSLRLPVGVAQQEISPEPAGFLNQDVALGDETGPHPPAPRLFVVNGLLSDNGDEDGWADTNETVAMRITVYNRLGVDLTGVSARLSTDDPKIACITDATLFIGNLAAGELRSPSQSFGFAVADTDRTNPAEDFSVTFGIALSANEFEDLPEEQVTIDLDLDVTGGSGPTTYFESFENGFGTFTTMHLDESLNPPDSDFFNSEAGVLNADGYRCQYSDPDWVGSVPYGSGAADICHPNPSDLPDAYWFHVTEDRAFSGSASLHWGTFISVAEGFTTPTSQLEAIRTSEPINLAWEVDRTCSLSGNPCTTSFDCQIGESCVHEASELSFKHQISLMDYRTMGLAANRTSDRGVVYGQLADDAGEPMGNWIKLYPYVNIYDSRANSNFFSCGFDPTDDGNTEEDFFDPTDPNRFFGPSSTCAPDYSFSHQGSTDGAFSPTNLGDAPDGPGLEGSIGVGTWVEPRIDLERYRGRRIRVRFLETGIEFQSRTWHPFLTELDPGDDGWFIDDVTLTRTLTSPASVAADTNPNIDLKGDFDLDDVAATCDCAPDDGTVWGLPGEVVVLSLTSVPGQPSMTTMLAWDPPVEPGGTAPEYEVVFSPQPNGFGAGLGCILSGTETEAFDETDPAPGDTEFFLVRTRNACGSGPVGFDSSSNTRLAVDCP